MEIAVNPSTLRSRRRRAKMTAAERTAYQAKYAHKRRLDLVRELSPEGVCDGCGAKVGHENLEVDHANGIGWIHESLNQHRRYARYWKEYEAGVPMRALCIPCNSRDGQRFRPGFDKAGRRRAA